ncbi:MAG: hypothetical protein SGARI_002185 [Bacillariaceae sp.]
MKFSSVAVLALVANSATGFAPVQRHLTVPRSALSVSYDLDLGDDYAPKKGKKAAPAPAPVPAPVPVPAPAPVKAKRTPKAKAPAPAPPAPTPAPEPKAKKVSKKKAPEPVAPPAPAPVVKAKKVKAPKPVVVPTPPPKKPVAVTTKDPNAAAGVALGGAPLLLAPLAALAAGRSVLSGTSARRQKIQEEMAEFERAKAKKAIQADVDGDALFGAVTYLGGAAAALALIVSSPFSSVDTPSFSLPSVSLPGGSSKAPATKTSAPSVVKKVEKKQVKKLKNTSPYDFSLEQEVKAAEKEVKKDVAAEKAAAAQVKKDEAAAKAAAKKEAAAAAAESKVS